MKLITKSNAINARLLWKSIKLFFQNISRDGIITNKTFWSTMKRFLTNKGHISSDKVIIKKANKSENYVKLLTNIM